MTSSLSVGWGNDYFDKGFIGERWKSTSQLLISLEIQFPFSNVNTYLSKHNVHFNNFVCGNEPASSYSNTTLSLVQPNSFIQYI